MDMFSKSYISASGLLKGFDPLLNLVLDEATEYLRGRYMYMFFSKLKSEDRIKKVQ